MKKKYRVSIKENINYMKLWKIKSKKEKAKQKEVKQEEFEILLNDIDKCALYFKNREDKFVLIKDSNFPFMLNNPDIEFIDMNKENFEYYATFNNLESMIGKIVELEKEEALAKKTENDYLIDYLEHSKCNSDYLKITDRMKNFEIDNSQYNKMLAMVKSQIQKTVKNMLSNYKNSNKDLETNRTYKEIMNSLMDIDQFKKKYPYEYYQKNIKYGEESISTNGYPDYMWQAGAEGTYINLARIPNSRNSVFEYNLYSPQSTNDNDGYISKFAIVSDKERETILKHWEEFQERNELRFESQYMASIMKTKEEEEEM